jgi:hypothetical protein
MTAVVAASVLSAALAGLAAFVAARSLQVDTEIPFVVLDAGRLVSASINDMKGRGIDDLAAIEAATLFADRLNSATQRYVDAGYVVISKGAVIGNPAQLDITPLVANELDLKLD